MQTSRMKVHTSMHVYAFPLSIHCMHACMAAAAFFKGRQDDMYVCK